MDFEERIAYMEELRIKAAQDMDEIHKNKKSILEDFVVPPQPPPAKKVKNLKPKEKYIPKKAPQKQVIKEKPKQIVSKKNYVKENKERISIQSQMVKEENTEVEKITLNDPKTYVKQKKKKELTFEERIIMKNPRFLKEIFSRFSDLVISQWDEASDLLIEEMLLEEVDYLNTLYTFEPPENIPEFIEEVANLEEELRQKYLA